MVMFFNLVLIAIGFVLLIKGADFLVDGASSLAKRFNVSDIVIGLTVVAMGTSAPELVVNAMSGVIITEEGTHDVVFGNIIGSNIFNLYLILGISAIIYPLTVQRNALWREIPFSLAVTMVFFILANDVLFFDDSRNSLDYIDALILILLFGLFMVYIFLNIKRNPDITSLDEIPLFGSLRTTLMIIGGIAGLIFGGQLIVENAVKIAEYYNVSEKLIGLTILAAGTSLPELATSAVAAFKKKSDLAVGNIIGSNIFNVLLVLGITTFMHAPLGYNVQLNMDLYICMGGTLLLFFFMYSFGKYKLDRIEGVFYLLGFLGYFIFIFYRQ
jgi:cation:H+ antiporter